MRLRAHFTYDSAAAGADKWRDQTDEQFHRFVSDFGSVEISKRVAYPGTFVIHDNQKLYFGYGQAPAQILDHQLDGSESLFYEDEFFVACVDLRDRSITIQRDAYCTWPLFYRRTDHTFDISEDLDELLSVAQEPAAVNRSALSSLILQPYITWETLFQDVELLPERARITWKAGKVQKTTPATNATYDMVHPGEFKRKLESTVHKYWQRIDSEYVAFECSGGLDSITAPAILAKQGIPITTATMLFPAEFGISQKQKMDGFANQFNAQQLVTPVLYEQDYPLARFLAHDLVAAFYQYQEIYTESLSRQAQALQAQGTEVVFVGIGGDELFENEPPEEEHETEISTLPDYFSQKGKGMFRGAHRPSHQKSNSLVPDSALFAAQSRNKIYIDHDIWPVAPLADPGLYAYCQGLDIALRSNKNILRAYHEATGLPSNIYHPVQNEHFGRFFEDAIKRSYPDVLPNFLKNSYFVSEGFVDADKLMADFDGARWSESGGDTLFQIFRLLTADIILQAHRNPI